MIQLFDKESKFIVLENQSELRKNFIFHYSFYLMKFN